MIRLYYLQYDKNMWFTIWLDHMIFGTIRSYDLQECILYNHNKFSDACYIGGVRIQKPWISSPYFWLYDKGNIAVKLETSICPSLHTNGIIWFLPEYI